MASGPPIDDSFLEEGSPTMVEQGVASVFQMGVASEDEDDNKESHQGGGGGEGGGATAVVDPGGARQRKQGRGPERAEPRVKRESWIDPPEERESTALTQAEVESCM